MKWSGAVQLLLALSLGAAALVFLKWRNANLDAESARLSALLSDSIALSRRRDSLPKPFALLKAPALPVVPPKPAPARPASPIKLLAEVGEPVSVSVTAYCLQGTTRAGTGVREGIVAADPRVFPLGSEIELSIRGKSLGMFKVEDTGLLIKGRKIDIWLEDCAQARVFGRKRGIAVRSPKIRR